MNTAITNIWRYNAATGYWMLVRDCYRENAKRWKEIFEGDEPGIAFKVSKKRPVKKPE